MLRDFCRNCYLFLIALCRQIPHEDIPAKKLRLSKPSKSAALHIDLCKATNSTDALQYLLQFARKPVEAESVEGVVRILLEHYYKVKNYHGLYEYKDLSQNLLLLCLLLKHMTTDSNDNTIYNPLTAVLISFSLS